MEFRVLGPVAVQAGGRVEVVAGKLRRTLLGLLLVRANQPVPVDALTDGLWGDQPDPRAAQKLQLHIHRLRGLLDDPERLSYGAAGYRLRVEPGEIDAERFDMLVRAAEEAEPQRAVETLRAALALWRGTPFVGSEQPALADWARRLTERRLTAYESLYEAELACGLHEAVLGELTDLVRENPLRERLHGLLMTALYRAGRQSEALAVYQHARATLVAELGLEPGPELRGLHQRVLDGTLSAPAPAHRPEVPAQLPVDVHGFVGRDTELAELDRLLSGEKPVVVSAVAGTAGVGKTALAVHWAHRARDRFPDGQLYVDLRGYGPDEPVTAADALAGFLRALGLDGAAIPEDLAERAARFRSIVDQRRILVLLDNARTVDQVRPLLAARVTLVTSRDSLAGLVAREGAHRLRLDRLPVAEATGLLRTQLGARADAEPAAVSALVERCARLPLALRVAAELIRSRPSRAIGDLADELADHDALDVLDIDGDQQTAVRAVFSWSYRQLEPTAAAVFRLLGVHPGHDTDAAAMAAMAGAGSRETRRALDVLLRAHLVDQTAGDRYQSHDLLRVYAAELAGDATEAMARLRAYYLAAVAAAHDVIAPHEAGQRPATPATDLEVPVFDSYEAAFHWLDRERANLLAVTQHAEPAYVIAISDTVWRYLSAGNYHEVAVRLHTRALRAAEKLGDHTAEANARRVLGHATTWTGTLAQAIEHLSRALHLYGEVGDRLMQAATLNNIGITYWRHGDLAGAADDFRRALALFQQTDPRFGVPAMTNLGRILITLRQFDEAAKLYEQAALIAVDSGNGDSETRALSGLARASAMGGRPEEALLHARHAVANARRTGNRSLECTATMLLGTAHRGLGDHEQALRHQDAALAMARVAGDTDQIADALNELAATHLVTGNLAQARRHYQEVLAEDAQVHRDEYAHALAGLSDVYAAQGDHEQAVKYRHRALSIYRELGMPQAAALAGHPCATGPAM